MDERYAAIDVAGKGLVIFSAFVHSLSPSKRRLTPVRSSRCSHAGIVNVVKDAVRKLVRPVYMVSRIFPLLSSLGRQSR